MSVTRIHPASKRSEKLINEGDNAIQGDNESADLSDVALLSALWERGVLRDDFFDVKSDGVEFGELLTRYLYLRACINGRFDLKGTDMLLKGVVNRAYDADIPFLHEPHEFFNNLPLVFGLITQKHDEVMTKRSPLLRKTRNIRGYTLFHLAGTKNKLTPHVLLHWGTPLANLVRLDEQGFRLLHWLRSFDTREAIIGALQYNDTFGLGIAISLESASSLAHELANTYRLLSLE